MVVAVRCVWMMKVAADKIVDVIAVRYCGVPTVGTVYVPRWMSAALMARGARVRILRRHRQHMFLDFAVGKWMVQVPVV